MIIKKKTVSRPEPLRKKGQQINRVRIQFASVKKALKQIKKLETYDMILWIDGKWHDPRDIYRLYPNSEIFAKLWRKKKEKRKITLDTRRQMI